MDVLRDWLDQGRPVTVLDVRSSDQHAEWAIPGSVHVDAYEALKAHDPEAVSEIQLPLDRPVVTICAMGRVSLSRLNNCGGSRYEALSLEGGMKAWSLAEYCGSSAEEQFGTGDPVRRTGRDVSHTWSAAETRQPSIDRCPQRST
jgi:rhodanese-related sulfurtransferase